MKDISYLVGKQYCILLIPTKKAEERKIANESEIEINEHSTGITIRNRET
jgi:hypothetical protein